MLVQSNNRYMPCHLSVLQIYTIELLVSHYVLWIGLVMFALSRGQNEKKICWRTMAQERLSWHLYRSSWDIFTSTIATYVGPATSCTLFKYKSQELRIFFFKKKKIYIW